MLLGVRVLILRSRRAPRVGGRGAARGSALAVLLLRHLAVGRTALLRCTVLRLLAIGVLRLLPVLLLLAELRLLTLLRAAELGLLLTELLLGLTLLAVRVLRLLTELRLTALLLRHAELRLLRLLLAELRRLPELGLAALLRRRAELRLLRCLLLRILLLRPGSRAPGQRCLLLRAGAAGLCAGRLALVAHGRDRPLRGRRLGLRGGRLCGGLTAGLGGVLGRYRPLRGLGLRSGRRGGLLGRLGFGRRVGHGSARYPTNPRQVTPPPQLSPDCGVTDALVHLAWTTTEEAILSLHVCDFGSHSGHR